MTKDTNPARATPIDMVAALANPSGYFGQPQDVLMHPALSADDREKLLRQWELDALRLSEAEGEGMTGGEESMLGRVRQALLMLAEGAGEVRGSIGTTAKSVAGGLEDAAGRLRHAACKTRGGTAEIREIIRAQPITAGLLLFGFGYVFGRLGALLPSTRR